MVRTVGFEPTSSGSRSQCLKPLGYALKMVGEMGFEPTHFVSPRHGPSQLGHSPMVGTLRIELS